MYGRKMRLVTLMLAVFMMLSLSAPSVMAKGNHNHPNKKAKKQHTKNERCRKLEVRGIVCVIR
jgi:hypothetical protein